jgi:hypothetical protein
MGGAARRAMTELPHLALYGGRVRHAAGGRAVGPAVGGGQPLAEVKRAARRVEPYIAADGSPRWSVRLVGVELAAQRRRQRAPRAGR